MGRAYEVRKASMAKTSVAKSKVYSKFGKEIYVAARKGTPDIESNVALKTIVEKAKSNQVPADVINRAIEKAKGTSKDSYDQILYEGFGPAGSTFMIECLTDNVNRTYSEVRNCFTKSNSKLGVSGAVAHMYKNSSVFTIDWFSDEDTLLEFLMENEIEFNDIEADGNICTIYADLSQYRTIRDVLETYNPEGEFLLSETMWVSDSQVDINDEEDVKNFNKLMSMLEECDDVSNIYNNVGEVSG